MQNKRNQLGFLFPGQGSQSLEMLADLSSSFPVVTQTFDTASEIVGRNLWKLVCDGSLDELNQTTNTQPIMLAAGVAVWRVWTEKNATLPAWMAGHSLGEYTALVCSNAVSYENAVQLVSERARLMQEAVPIGVGAMAAILGLDTESVENICNNLTSEMELVAPVNLNAPGQIVIAGHASTVQKAIDAAKEAGAKRALILPVSVPSHCLLMQPAAEQLRKFLNEIEFCTPSIKIIHNADVLDHQSGEDIRQALEKQLYRPVRWIETIAFLEKQGVTEFVECGPGRILLGLNKRIAKASSHFAIHDNETLIQVLEYIE